MVLPVDDDVQLSVVQYRNKLYEVRGVRMFIYVVLCIYCMVC